MVTFSFHNALWGGLLIGLSATLMLIFMGRVTGISGILNGLLSIDKTQLIWRFLFLAGLFSGGLCLQIIYPESLLNITQPSNFKLAVAGLLVGFGTTLGSGCTSGHGICGISRLSIRSILATIAFMFSGFATVLVIQLLGWG